MVGPATAGVRQCPDLSAGRATQVPSRKRGRARKAIHGEIHGREELILLRCDTAAVSMNGSPPSERQSRTIAALWSSLRRGPEAAAGRKAGKVGDPVHARGVRLCRARRPILEALGARPGSHVRRTR